MILIAFINQLMGTGNELQAIDMIELKGLEGVLMNKNGADILL